ncbi:MAG: RNA polymerase sigma factor [Elusimicrobiota bacterium]|jgi:RNA polymerase sigma-70 factor (ECF subfamily)|nr:RNA polymerase sigma factor [Elusimicrobiota bacterium]
MNDTITLQIKPNGAQDFEALIEKYKDALYSFIFYSVRSDEGAAGDIFQDTLLKALGDMGKYKEEGKFKAWLFTIARNKITDHFRANAKFVQLPQDADADIFAAPNSAQNEAESNISLQEIQGFIGRLPKEQREVILLRPYLSFKEIAQTLGCPLGTVLARMNRGIKKLQQYMGEEYAA